MPAAAAACAGPAQPALAAAHRSAAARPRAAACRHSALQAAAPRVATHCPPAAAGAAAACRHQPGAGWRVATQPRRCCCPTQTSCCGCCRVAGLRGSQARCCHWRAAAAGSCPASGRSVPPSWAAGRAGPSSAGGRAPAGLNCQGAVLGSFTTTIKPVHLGWLPW